jgi:hypothetical protein
MTCDHWNEPQADAIRKAFPRWIIWHSTGSDGVPGAWYATRIGRITVEQEQAGAEATVACDTLPALIGALAEQTVIFTRVPAVPLSRAASTDRHA